MYLWLIKCISLILFVCLHADDPSWTNSGAYLQVSSHKSQIPAAATGSLIIFESIDAIKNFDVSPNKDTITCKVPGIYFVCCGLQIAALNQNVAGYLDCWYVLNGKPLVASNSRQYITPSLSCIPTVDVFLIELKENDTLSTAFIASGPEIGIICIDTDVTLEPRILSFGWTLYKL